MTKSKILSLTALKISTKRSDRKKFQQKKVPNFRKYGHMQKIRQIVLFSFEIVIGSLKMYNMPRKLYWWRREWEPYPSRRKRRATNAPRTEIVFRTKRLFIVYFLEKIKAVVMSDKGWRVWISRKIMRKRFFWDFWTMEILLQRRKSRVFLPWYSSRGVIL